MSKAAILIDGNHYLIERQKHGDILDPSEEATRLLQYCDRLAQDIKYSEYRVHYYDCRPFETTHKSTEGENNRRTVRNPTWRGEFLDALEKQEKENKDIDITVKLGYLKSYHALVLTPDAETKLYDVKYKKNSIYGTRIKELTEDDFKQKVHQKGVDMQIGIDIVEKIVHGKVSTIILVANDIDFYPAVDYAKDHDMTVYLDTLGAIPATELQERVNGLIESSW